MRNLLHPLGANKHTKKKHIDTFFVGLSRIFGDFVYVFFSPRRNDPEKKTHKPNFATLPRIYLSAVGGAAYKGGDGV